ncbi:MAG: hypothetical protein M0P71_16185 [Melioribacteraceae bacterium]|jgi:hypothetical protein|nr:hypothetical protein [Melioribacteraceae bacterium]
MPIFNESARKQYQKKYKRKTKQIRSYTNTAQAKRPFLCFDGETENNIYTELGNSVNYIYDKKGLSTYDCLRFLYFEGKGSIKIIFAIHFDVQHWIKDLSDNDIIAFLDGEIILYRCFEIQYITKRFISISWKNKKVYIYDISSFFQTSLLKTIENMKIELTKNEKYILEKGKKLRAVNFKGMTKKEMIKYNQTECIVTEKIADKLRNILIDTKLKYGDKTFNLYPSRFYGCGAVAKKILKVLEMEKHKEREDLLSNKIKKFIYMSYYGGRAECFQIGTFNNIYKYDINSAYPDVMRKLKLPVSYKIKKINKTCNQFNFIDGNIYKLEYHFENLDTNLIGILPYRRKDGYVMFPKKARGYYYGIEAKYLNEMKKYGNGYFKIIEVLEIVYSDTSIFQNGFIEYIYKERRELKRKGDISNVAYKLAMNSLYGKMAQQTGNRQFTNILFASYITACTRAKILDALFSNNAIKQVIQISTDGIFIRKKLNLPISGELGDWEEDYYKKAVVLGSGLYGLFGKKETFALRGLFVSKDNFDSIYKILSKKDTAEIKYNCFIGHRFALTNYKKYGKFRLCFAQITKTISPYTYEKRLYLHKKRITDISISKWYDIFNKNEKNIDTNKLKKFELDLEDDAIQTNKGG